MPRSVPIELLSFRRTFALLMVLVAVPSAGLTGLGVVAILNERAAVEKRLASVWQDRLDTLATRLRQTLEASRFSTAARSFRIATTPSPVSPADGTATRTIRRAKVRRKLSSSMGTDRGMTRSGD